MAAFAAESQARNRYSFFASKAKKEGFFQIDMHKCPSKGMLNSLDYMEPYKDYCEHCEMLYKRVVEPLGFKYDIDLSKTKNAKCILTINKK